MKELSIENKAELYEEAIKRAKSKIKNDKNHVFYEDDIIEIFPELKETEDERIRKDIIAILHLYFGKPLDDEAKEMIDWVEKQSQTFTKKDVDDAYLKGVCDAKQELEKQSKKVEPIEGFNTEFEKQVSYLIASAINKEYEYTEPFVKYVSNSLLNYAKHEIDKQDENKKQILEFNANDWYVSKVDSKIHDMTYNSANKVEPNKKNNMKVFGCNAQLPYSGGGILVAANNLDEAFETAARKYDRLFDCLRQENGHIIPTSIDEAEVISSDLYPKYKWKEITELTCNCDKPHVIIENSYEE